MNAHEKVTPSLELISGAYSSVLWGEIEDWVEDENSPRFIYNALNILHSCGKDQEAYELVKALYDMVGLELPADVDEICKNPDDRAKYITELLMDIEDMI